MFTDNEATNVVEFVGRFFRERVLAVEGKKVDNFCTGNLQVALAVKVGLLELAGKSGHELQVHLQLGGTVHHVGGIVGEVPTRQDIDLVLANFGEQIFKEFLLGVAENILAVLLRHLFLDIIGNVSSKTVCNVVVGLREINGNAVNRVLGTVGRREAAHRLHFNIEEAQVNLLHVRFQHTGL